MTIISSAIIISSSKTKKNDKKNIVLPKEYHHIPHMLFNRINQTQIFIKFTFTNIAADRNIISNIWRGISSEKGEEKFI